MGPEMSGCEWDQSSAEPELRAGWSEGVPTFCKHDRPRAEPTCDQSVQAARDGTKGNLCLQPELFWSQVHSNVGLTLLEERPSLVLLLCDQKEQKVRFLDPYLDRVKF